MALRLTVLLIALAAPALAQPLPERGVGFVEAAARCAGITHAFQAYFEAQGDADAAEMRELSALFGEMASTEAAKLEASAATRIPLARDFADVETTGLIDTATNGLNLLIASEASTMLAERTDFCERLRGNRDWYR